MDTGALSGDEITLTVPAEAGYARIGRVCVGALAARIGFTYGGIEELRLAICEAWALLLGSEPHPGVVELQFSVRSDALTVDLRLISDEDSAPLPTTELPVAASMVTPRPGRCISISRAMRSIARTASTG